MIKVNNRNTITKCEICSKLTIKTPKRRHWRRSGAFIVNFEHTSHLVLLFLLLTLSRLCHVMLCLFIFRFPEHKYSFNIKHTISLTWNKTKITLQEAQKRGKFEEASTADHIKVVNSTCLELNLANFNYMGIVSKTSKILVDAKIIFFNRILNTRIVTASNRSLFGAINLFHKCGPR